MNQQTTRRLSDDAWVYCWFPLFREANRAGAIEDYTAKWAPSSLREAQRRAVDWVVTRVQMGSYTLPQNFRIPLAYQARDHHDFDEIVRIAKHSGYPLRRQHIPLALFLSRGLFYQALAYEKEAASYLPHSFRAALLSDVDQQAASFLCAATVSLGSAADVLRQLDAIMLERAASATPIQKPVYRGVAIGSAFMRGASSPRMAFEQVMTFRDSPAGRDLRERVRQLVRLADAGATPTMELHLAQFDRQLRDVLIYRFGYAPPIARAIPDGDAILFSLLGGAKDLLRAALYLLPPDINAAISKLLHTPLTRPSGFQLIFARYLPNVAARHKKRKNAA